MAFTRRPTWRGERLKEWGCFHWWCYIAGIAEDVTAQLQGGTTGVAEFVQPGNTPELRGLRSRDFY